MTKGFTLIELLIVIAIVAVLAVAVVLVLNPAELIKQGRDATRLSDLGTIQSAIGYYLSTAASPSVTAKGRTGASAGPPAPATPFSTSSCIATNWSAGHTNDVNGTGWVAVDLTGAQGGSPLGVLPVDPQNTATMFYAFCGSANAVSFELDTVLESAKYIGRMANAMDGGNNVNFYEVGTVGM